MQRWAVIIGGAALLALASCTETVTTTRPGQMPTTSGLDPDTKLSASTVFAHGHMLERQGEYRRAARQYQRAIQMRPEFAAARNRLGITMNKMGLHWQATEEFKRAVELKPQKAFLHNNLGFSLYLEGDFVNAETALRRALKLDPKFARAHTNLGVVLAKQGRFDEAFEEFSAVGSEADAYYNLAMVQTEAQLFADAALSLEKALELDPDFDEARTQLQVVARAAAKYALEHPELAQAEVQWPIEDAAALVQAWREQIDCGPPNLYDDVFSDAWPADFRVPNWVEIQTEQDQYWANVNGVRLEKIYVDYDRMPGSEFSAATANEMVEQDRAEALVGIADVDESASLETLSTSDELALFEFEIYDFLDMLEGLHPEATEQPTPAEQQSAVGQLLGAWWHAEDHYNDAVADEFWCELETYLETTWNAPATVTDAIATG